MLAFMQGMALAQRAKFDGPVVALTGSNGKTTVKEWVAQLLPASVALHRSPFTTTVNWGTYKPWSLGTHHDPPWSKRASACLRRWPNFNAASPPQKGCSPTLEKPISGISRTHVTWPEKNGLFRGCRQVFMPATLCLRCETFELPCRDLEFEWAAPEADLQATATQHPGGFQLSKGESAQVQLGMHDDVSVHNALTASGRPAPWRNAVRPRHAMALAEACVWTLVERQAAARRRVAPRRHEP